MRKLTFLAALFFVVLTATAADTLFILHFRPTARQKQKYAYMLNGRRIRRPTSHY